MESIIRGTLATDAAGTEADILQQAGVDYLQRLAGYIPQKMPSDAIVYPPMQPLHPDDAQYADELMSRFCGERVYGVNPRVPFLMAVWMLIGRDNPYQIYNHLDKNPNSILDSLILEGVTILLRIACGDTPPIAERHDFLSLIKTIMSEYFRGIQKQVFFNGQGKRTESQIKNFNRNKSVINSLYNLIEIMAMYNVPVREVWSNLSHALGELARFYGIHVYKFTQNKARAWSHISDDEVGDIVRDFLFETSAIVSKRNINS